MHFLLFIDGKRSVGIEEGLLEARRIYTVAPYHLLLVTNSVFTRAWCLFELAVRKQVRFLGVIKGKTLKSSILPML